MSTTYEMLSAFARSAGTVYCFALFLGVLVYALWPSNREAFNKAARMPLARTERWRRPKLLKSTRSRARPPRGMSGTASVSSIRRCRAGGCILFYATIVFAVVYWVLYPAWPLASGYTPGVLGYTNRIAGRRGRRGHPG